MMMNARAASALENERFRNKLQASSPNYAYQVLLLEIIVQDDLYHRKPTIDEISRLIQLYMVAVEVLQSSADNRYDYFKRKIHNLMMKKHIVEQLALGRAVDATTLQECNRVDLEQRKNQHEAQVYFNKTDNSKVQEIIKKAEIQVKTLNNNLKNSINSQEVKLEERIKMRKMKSESGSVSKFKIGAHNAQANEATPPRRNDRLDPRMDYFEDYGKQAEPHVTTPVTCKNIRDKYVSAEKGDPQRHRIIDYI